MLKKQDKELKFRTILLSSLLIGVIGRKMIQLTYGTVGALVASHTGTSIVIYSVGTICTVFARISVTVVDI